MKLAAVTCCIILLFAGCTMRRPFPFFSGWIEMGESKIYYERDGSGKDTVILLHAGFLDANMWKQQAEEFYKHGLAFVAIDLPGHGKTQNDTIRYLPADFIKAVMDSLKISKASLVGVSLGASCVTDFIIAHPERVNKAVLVSAGLSGWDTRFPQDSMVNKYIDSFFGALEKKDSADAAEVFTHMWFDGPFRTPQQMNDTARRYIYETVSGNIKTHKVRGWPTFAQPPAIDKLSSIKIPVLILYGDKDMPIINLTTSYLERNIANAKRILIPGTGHMLNMEAPGKFNKEVIDFISKKQE